MRDSFLSTSCLDNTFNSSGVGGNSISNQIRAQAFVTLGKFCLRDRHLAKEHINVFLLEIDYNKAKKKSYSASSDELHKPNSHAVRSNALLVLGDLCVRFTNLIDRHVGSLASCLQVKENKCDMSSYLS